MNDILGFGKFIAEKRKSLGLTLRGTAAELGIAPAYLSDIEKGRRYPPDIDKLMQIAKILKLTEEDRKSTRLNSSHANISYAVFCLKKKKKTMISPHLIKSP